MSGQSAAEEHHILPANYRLEEYEIIRTLGIGGFGVTYLGRDLNLDKQVAIKEYFPGDIAVRQKGSTVLPRSEEGRNDFDWGLERFIDEAKVLAKFDHPNIVRVSRFFKANSTAYIVMEYIDGEPLSDFLNREAPLDERELKALVLPVMDGLDKVHAENFLHRDIKPDNIMLRPDGSPVLLDFGAARTATGGKSKTLTAILTPGYAPIEQYSEKSAQGPFTDIYALAAVCYRAIVNERPQDASDRILEDQMPILSEANLQGWSGAFLRAIDAAFQVRPNDRPASLEQLFEIMEGDEEDSVQDRSPPVSDETSEETMSEAEQAEEYYQRGEALYQQEHYEEATEWLVPAVDMRHPQALLTFGDMLATGKGVEENQDEAFKCFMWAAEQGEDTAQWNVATYYLEGKASVEQDHDEALKWIRLSASMENVAAQNWLAETDDPQLAELETLEAEEASETNAEMEKVLSDRAELEQMLADATDDETRAAVEGLLKTNIELEELYDNQLELEELLAEEAREMEADNDVNEDASFSDMLLAFAALFGLPIIILLYIWVTWAPEIISFFSNLLD